MLYPLNRYLTVRPVDQREDEENSPVLVPDGYYENSPSAYMVVEIVKPHVKSELCEGTRLVAPRSAVEILELNGETYHLLLESHAMGFFSEA